MNYLNLEKARRVYSEGKNITEFLRKEFGESVNTSEIIEIAYDLQAGTYIDKLYANQKKAELHADETAYLLEPHLIGQTSLLDVGAGELTSLCLMLNRIKSKIEHVLALDISWSRLHKGRDFFQNNISLRNLKLSPFVADIKKIPLPSKSIDVVTSDHALELNGEYLPNLLMEIFRVTKKKCILFEPSYELNTHEGQLRMDKFGYIKNLEGAVSDLGGELLEVTLLKSSKNPLNPTACYVIEPPITEASLKNNDPQFSVPGSDLALSLDGSFLCSSDSGLIFPILRDIPILKVGNGILGTALFEDS